MLVTQEQLDAMASMGYKLYTEGKLDEATKIFEGLLVVASDSYYGYAGLGAVALVKDPPDLDGAIANLTMAVDLKPDSPTLHANLGEALLRNRQLSESAAEFKKAIEMDPEKKDAGANRARAIIEGITVAIGELKRMTAEPPQA